VKRAILGRNAARLYGIDARAEAFCGDVLADTRREYAAAGAQRSNLAYGLVRR
jgi:hypothetical protein